MNATLLIQRGAASESHAIERFEVPFVPGQSVLDGLRYIRSHFDPTLAFRFSCINANACKECMMLIDGEVEYACTTRLREGEMNQRRLGVADRIADDRVAIRHAAVSLDDRGSSPTARSE